MLGWKKQILSFIYQYKGNNWFTQTVKEMLDNFEKEIRADTEKMTITDDIEKSNFNPQMLKSCTDTSYQCGYEQGRADAIEELEQILHTVFNKQNNPKSKFRPSIVLMECDAEHILEQLKEQK